MDLNLDFKTKVRLSLLSIALSALTVAWLLFGAWLHDRHLIDKETLFAVTALLVLVNVPLVIVSRSEGMTGH